MTSKDFPPEVLELFDRYVHGALDRRGFLKEASRFAVGALTAAGFLEALSPRFAEAQQVSPADPKLSVSPLEFASPKGYGKARGYLAKPAATSGKPAAAGKPAAKRPVVLVIHENRGLNPHIEDIARRMALAGYIAFAPDALFPLGGYPGDEDSAREKFKQLDQAKTKEDFLAAAALAKGFADGNGKVGAVGFCYGGGMASFLATKVPDLGAAISFYGGAPALEDVPAIRCPVQLHYAENDERINAQRPAYEAALKAAKIRYEAHDYAGAQHGFNNDTTPRYDANAAKLAWERTLAFFGRHLKA